MRTVKSSSQNFFQSLILKIGHLRFKSRYKPPGNTPLPAINRSHENTEILDNLNIAIQISIKKKGIAISQNFDFSIALQQNTYTLPRCNIYDPRQHKICSGRRPSVHIEIALLWRKWMWNLNSDYWRKKARSQTVTVSVEIPWSAYPLARKCSQCALRTKGAG